MAGVVRIWRSEKTTTTQTKSSFDFLIASSSMAIFETRSPLTSMRDSWSSHPARATRCLYSSQRADSHSAHQLRDTQLETLCKNVDRVQAWLLRSVFQIVEERIV
jgi:hypothetical protein